MANINIDTIKIRECGNDLLQLSQEYGEIIDLLFRRIASMEQTGEMVGQAAQDISNIARNDKLQYLQFKKDLDGLAKILIHSASSYENATRNNRI